LKSQLSSKHLLGYKDLQIRQPIWCCSCWNRDARSTEILSGKHNQ